MGANTDTQESGKRKLILEGALRVFSQKGFHNAKPWRKFAEAAGVGRGTVYLYFTSKTDLFVSVVEEKLKEIKEALTEHIENIEGACAKLAGAIKLHWEFFNRSREFVQVILSDLSGMEKELDERTREARTAFVAVLESVIKEGISRGGIQGDRAPNGRLRHRRRNQLLAFANLMNEL